jgi:hypothetical protein
MPSPHGGTILEIIDSDELEYTDNESSSEPSENELENDPGNIHENLNTPEPEVQILTPPAKVPQKRRRGPKSKSLLHFQAIYALFFSPL